MDRITRSLVNAFVAEQNIDPVDDSTAFEHFCNYCVLSREFSDDFDVLDIHAGGGNDTGLDGIAIVVNGFLVNSIEDVDDLAKTNQFLDVTFLFTQAKTSNKFNTSDFGTFAFGVKDFFSETSKLPRNDEVNDAAGIASHILAKGQLMTKGKPICRLYYITTGKWADDATFSGRMESERLDLEQSNLFRLVEVYPVDADGVQRFYNDTQNKVLSEIAFTTKVALPDITGVREAYLGILPADEYLKLITDETGAIRRNLFYDNVRDYQGDVEVNREIEETLHGGEQTRFVILRACGQN